MVGFTDEFHSTVAEPPLTSVTHQTKKMGQEAARLFFDRIKKGAVFSEKVELKADLIIRESTQKKLK